MDMSNLSLTELPYGNEWKIVGYVQLGWFMFIILLNGLLFIWYTNMVIVRQHFQGYAISFTLFVLFKALGGIFSTVLFDSKGLRFNTGIYIAAYVFDSVAIGGLLRALFPFLQIMLNEGFEGANFEKVEVESNTTTTAPKQWLKPNNHLFRLLTVIVLAAVIISIVGSSQIDFSNPSQISNTLFRVSSVLFIAAIVLCSVLLGYIYLTRPTYSKYALLVSGVIPLIFVRCLYSVLSAFHGLSYTSPYILLFGDYKYYAFMALLCEGLVAPIYIVILHVFVHHYKYINSSKF